MFFVLQNDYLMMIECHQILKKGDEIIKSNHHYTKWWLIITIQHLLYSHQIHEIQVRQISMDLHVEKIAYISVRIPNYFITIMTITINSYNSDLKKNLLLHLFGQLSIWTIFFESFIPEKWWWWWWKMKNYSLSLIEQILIYKPLSDFFFGNCIANINWTKRRVKEKFWNLLLIIYRSKSIIFYVCVCEWIN